MRHRLLPRCLAISIVISGVNPSPRAASAQQQAAGEVDGDPASVLPAARWEAAHQSADRGLSFLAGRQDEDGSFAGPSSCQPAVTSLCVMAFLSRGHVPGQGQYGRQLDKAIDYVLAMQRDSGLFSAGPAEPYLAVQPQPWDDVRAHALYNHGISGLMLTEMYGMVDAGRGERIRKAVVRALTFTRTHQTMHKQLPRDVGGWRYMFHNNGMDADLSVTSWQLMFYRAARNAEFEVPKAYVDDAMVYVRSCFDPAKGRFRYSHVSNDYRYTRAMSAAGILALSLGGEHQSEMAQAAAASLLKDSFEYDDPSPYPYDRYHYSVFFCTLAMFQIGGRYWAEFYPPMVDELLQNQREDGSWDEESADAGFGKSFGNTYTTAMVVMSLTVTDQLIPIYQR